VKVCGIEVAGLLQPRLVKNLQLPAFERDEFITTKLLKGAVDVHRRDAGCVRKLRLRHRQLTPVILGEANCSHPDHQFAEHVRQPGIGLPPSDVCRPLAISRLRASVR
jgi:hypothetical protein